MRVRTFDMHANEQLISRHAGQFKYLRKSLQQNVFHSWIFTPNLRSSHYDIAKRRLLKYIETFWPGLTKFDGAYLPASSLRDILLAGTTCNSKPSSCKFFWLHFHSSHLKSFLSFLEHTKGIFILVESSNRHTISGQWTGFVLNWRFSPWWELQTPNSGRRFRSI